MRRAFTIIELLVAMVITLIMMGAVATLFGLITSGVQDARATIEMTERVRSATWRLQKDLDGATTVMLPPRRPESDEGYFEIIEGSLNDRLVFDPSVPATPVDLATASAGMLARFSRFGDTDDVLMFTTRTRGEPFVGKVPTSPQFPNGQAQSQTAEVIYFVAQSPTSTAINPQFTVYRRCLLVLPSFDASGITLANVNDFDLSVRTDGNKFYANTLGDLTKRENRALHTATFPHGVNFNAMLPLTGNRLGEDVILSSVLAFDVLVYDPGCPLKIDSGGFYLSPRENGYINAAYPGVNDPKPLGAFVDLGYQPIANGAWFAGPPSTKSKLAGAYGSPLKFTYDTYSAHYENDGIDQDTDSQIDLAVNGFDDNSDGVVDDPNEQETAPPYFAPLRGIKVAIRVYEPDSRQVREVNVESDFVPE